MATPKKVLVTGAGGQTGKALFQKLLAVPQEFQPLGIVRTEESKDVMLKTGEFPQSSLAVADITDADSIEKVATAFGCETVCICTSAKPQPTGEVDPETKRPLFGYPNGIPEVVDWVGQKNQIDAALKCGSGTHVVLCSSMGGTDPSNALNALGRTTKDDGSAEGGNILLWKRKAEIYLKDSGLPYTIVHPGGLVNEPGGERELVVGVDDDRSGTDSRIIPREDVAEVMLQAIRYEAFRGRSFDVRAKPPGDGAPTTNFQALLETLGEKNCNYALGESA